MLDRDHAGHTETGTIAKALGATTWVLAHNLSDQHNPNDLSDPEPRYIL